AKDTFYNARPLSWAFSRDHVEVVKLLVEAGSEGVEPTFRAAAVGGNVKVVQAILATGKVKQETLDATLAAVPAAKEDVVALLRKAGAKAAPSEAARFEPFAGSYRADGGATAEVKWGDGQLTVALDKRPAVRLQPEGEGEGAFKLAGDDAASLRFQKK